MKQAELKPGSRVIIMGGAAHQETAVVISRSNGVLTVLHEGGRHPGKRYVHVDVCRPAEHQHSNLAATVRIILKNKINIVFETEGAVMAWDREDFLCQHTH